MTEIEIIEQIGFRAEYQYNILQWWLGISFAIVAACHAGTEHLSRLTTGIIILLYAFYSINAANSQLTQREYIQASREALVQLSITTELSPIAEVTL